MKKLSAVALFLCTYATVWSQITITKNDMPSQRDTARYSTSGTRLKFDTTGANIIWDYSALAVNGQGIDSFLAPLNINPAYVLSFGFTDYGTRSNNLANTGPVSLQNVYSFYKKTNTYLSIDGFGAEYNSIPIPALYTTEDKVYQFPLTYGRMDTTPYDLTVTIPGFGSLHQVGTRYNSVDGWGTVITPYDTFQCLRLRAYTKEVDSVTISALGFTLPVPRTSLTYQWLANGQIIPVLEVVGMMQGTRFTPTSEKYRDRVRAIPPQFAIHVDFRADKTTCTTLDTVTFTNRTRPNTQGSTYLYTITPSTYTLVAGTTDSMASPKVMFTAPGLYTVSLHVESPAGGTTPAIGDTTKVDYITVTAPNGIAGIQADAAISLYPNPVSDILNVHASETIISVSLMNSLGQRVLDRTTDSKAVSINIRPYEEGTYLLDIETKAGHQIRKVVIQ